MIAKWSSVQILRTTMSFMLFCQELDEEGLGQITTEIAEAKTFFYAEDDHQQYLHKNPRGYCGLKGTGVSCPMGTQR